MKKHDTKTLSDADLVKRVAETRESLRTIRFGEAGSRTKDVKASRNLRKSVARALTELASRRKNA
jgi:ribosomal protein L29